MSAPSEIRLFNSLGRKLEPLTPLEAGRVRIYACGPTVYNHPHVGNYRTFLFEDFLRRALRFLGYGVFQVMNITDVDDKTIRGAQQRGMALADFTDLFVDSFFEDLDTLRIERVESYPRATEHVPEMIDLIEKLLVGGYAYQSDGSVFFRISAAAEYGRLSGVDPDNMQQGERVAHDEYEKEDVRDFALWKAAKDGEPAWDSPWGPGRPGWHIECSAMSMKHLGESFDVHCGGVDNMFPHHENEIAQSESATGKRLAHTWLHAEHLIVDGQKMSKSLGNQFTMKDLLERGAEPRSLRYLFLGTHYRQRLNFTFEALKAAGAALRRVDEMRFRLAHANTAGEPLDVVERAVETLLEDFTAALADDLNSSAALGAVFQFVKQVNKAIEEGRIGPDDPRRVVEALDRVDEVLGVLDPEAWEETGKSAGPSDDEIERKVRERQEARRRRDFAASDRLRDELHDMGVVIEDTPQGPRWRRE